MLAYHVSQLFVNMEIITMIKVALGLGSNLGDRQLNIKRAIELLEQRVITQVQISKILPNKALLKPNSPPEWDLEYLNCVVCGVTTLTPLELLKDTQRIERMIFPNKQQSWAPREIDIDILAYGNLSLTAKEVTIPHTSLLDRVFGIGLLAQIWPDWQCPVAGQYYQKTALEIAEKKGYVT